MISGWKWSCWTSFQDSPCELRVKQFKAVQQLFQRTEVEVKGWAVWGWSLKIDAGKWELFSPHLFKVLQFYFHLLWKYSVLSYGENDFRSSSAAEAAEAAEGGGKHSSGSDSHAQTSPMLCGNLHLIKVKPSSCWGRSTPGLYSCPVSAILSWNTTLWML